MQSTSARGPDSKTNRRGLPVHRQHLGNLVPTRNSLKLLAMGVPSMPGDDERKA